MTEHSLKNKAITGMAWNSIEKFAIQGISFVIGIILARILMPADYGLIGMLSIFFAFSELFIGSGLSMALIQKSDRTEVDYSTIFHFNLIVGLIFYLILFFSAPLIAQFFNAPQLTTSHKSNVFKHHHQFTIHSPTDPSDDSAGLQNPGLNIFVGGCYQWFNRDIHGLPWLWGMGVSHANAIQWSSEDSFFILF